MMIQLAGRNAIRIHAGGAWAEVQLADKGPWCSIVTSRGGRSRGRGLVEALRRARDLLAIEA